MDDRQVRAVDPFDLPDWLGTGDVTWAATASARGEPRVPGRLEAGDRALDCDLLAADQAFPLPMLPEAWRAKVHQAWSYGQVLLVEDDGRLTLAVPGSSFNADLALETLGRFAKAVGADPARFAVRLRL